ncbi:uncharacterized protein LOC142702217 [Rhinoderma darwinii]|uniref:uncharacterized protein LOC142702217 n=1 Tax=Rhinoderma darwinii TaxID=43563 RepID=UPI003F66AD54
MRQITCISLLYSGLLLLGISHILHVEGSTATNSNSVAITDANGMHTSTMSYVPTAKMTIPNTLQNSNLVALEATHILHVEGSTATNSNSVAITDANGMHTSTMSYVSTAKMTILNTLQDSRPTGKQHIPTTASITEKDKHNVDPYVKTTEHNVDLYVKTTEPTVKFIFKMTTSTTAEKRSTGRQKISMTTSTTAENKHTVDSYLSTTENNVDSYVNTTGIIIGCVVVVLILFIILPFIVLLRKKKSYSFELTNKSADDAEIPLNNVKA